MQIVAGEGGGWLRGDVGLICLNYSVSEIAYCWDFHIVRVSKVGGDESKSLDDRVKNRNTLFLSHY